MKKIDVYTDGSHLDKLNNGRLGCGGIMVDRSAGGLGKELDRFSMELKPEYMKQEFGADKCSNPTAEMVGALMALRNFNFPPDTEIIIKADYSGVREWYMGTWKIKEPYIKKIKEEIDKEIKKKGLEGRIRFEWVKGHQNKSCMDSDAYWNNMVDLLAKGQKP